MTELDSPNDLFVEDFETLSLESWKILKEISKEVVNN